MQTLSSFDLNTSKPPLCFYLKLTFDNFQGSKNSLYLNVYKQKLYLLRTDVDTFINESQVVLWRRKAMQNRHMHKLHSLCTFLLLTALLRKNGMSTPLQTKKKVQKITNCQNQIMARKQMSNHSTVLFLFFWKHSSFLQGVLLRNNFSTRECLFLV